MNVTEEIDVHVKQNGFTSDCIVSACDVKTAVHWLKAHKSDGSWTHHFLHTGDDLHTYIGLLFLRSSRGFPPFCTISPIPVGCNVSVTNSANFRGIALSYIFVKIFDHIILRHSIHMCTMILKESLAYYNTNNSTAFCTFLDASKAFDRVRYCKLFRLLIDRGLPPCIIRMLICLYINNKVHVAWNGVHSQYFLATNGVKRHNSSSVIVCSHWTCHKWMNLSDLSDKDDNCAKVALSLVK